MQINKEGIDLIKKFEGCRLKAYKCPAGIWTIGYGNTFYEDGMKVKEGDVITQERAESLAAFVITQFAVTIAPFIKQPLTDKIGRAHV